LVDGNERTNYAGPGAVGMNNEEKLINQRQSHKQCGVTFEVRIFRPERTVFNGLLYTQGVLLCQRLVGAC
jgi:hypothetical protein